MDDIINYTIRMPRSLKDAMKESAAMHGRSLNQHFVTVAQQFLDGALVPKSAVEPTDRALAYLMSEFVAAALSGMRLEITKAEGDHVEAVVKTSREIPKWAHEQVRRMFDEAGALRGIESFRIENPKPAVSDPDKDKK